MLSKTVKPVALIATYHSDHAQLAADLFAINPETIIFIEKPPVVTLRDLEILIDLYNTKAKIEIGFNRRFTNFSNYVKRKTIGKKIIVTCSVKEVLVNETHWYLWPNQGTRITGNAVHWFDLATMWIESIPIEINFLSHRDDEENAAISILYNDGSIFNLTVSDKGNSLRGVQEKIEVRFDNESIFIDDFTSLTHIRDNGAKTVKRKWHRDKGHSKMYRNFVKNIDQSLPSDYTVSDLIKTSIVTISASQMLKNKERNKNIGSIVRQYLSRVDTHSPKPITSASL